MALRQHLRMALRQHRQGTGTVYDGSTALFRTGYDYRTHSTTVLASTQENPRGNVEGIPVSQLTLDDPDDDGDSIDWFPLVGKTLELELESGERLRFIVVGAGNVSPSGAPYKP